MSVALLDVLAPELAGETTARKETFLAIAAQVHTASELGAPTETMLTWYAAHLMPLSPGDGSGFGGGGPGAAGPITSKKAGELSIGFGSASAGIAGGTVLGDASLMLTTYGLNYLAVRSSRAAVAPFQIVL